MTKQHELVDWPFLSLDCDDEVWWWTFALLESAVVVRTWPSGRVRSLAA